MKEKTRAEIDAEFKESHLRAIKTIEKYRIKIIEDCMEGYTQYTHPAREYFPVPDNQRTPYVILYARSSISPIVARITKRARDSSSKDSYSVLIKNNESGEVLYNRRPWGEKLVIVGDFWRIYLDLDIKHSNLSKK